LHHFPSAEANYLFQVKEGVSEFLEEGGHLRVRIQWGPSFQLFQSTYSQYDEVVKVHNQQMR
jgi:hypothetical protein